MPAFEEGVRLAKLDIENIVSNTDSPDFQNTIVALDLAGDQLSLVADIFFNILECNGDDEMHEIAEKAQQLLVEYENDLFQNERLFERVKAV